MAIEDGKSRDVLFAAMYDRHYARLVRYLRSYRVPDADARDLAQETFLRFYQRLEQYRGEAEWAFLERIARNLLSNWWRGRSALKRNAPTVDLDDPGVHASVTPDYADRLHEARNRKLLYDTIAGLPPGQQQCLHLWLDGFRYEEIARVLRVTVDAVKSRLRDAKKALHAQLGDQAELERILPEDES